jgi:4-amino-4-deoxy-L-arabinose transferase-like glycosyltransferase
VFAAVVAGTLIVRLVVGSQLHLTEDEAYYRLWARTPAFGYYDHPPMIAWWIWLGVHLAGDNSLGVRLMSILGCAATSGLVFLLARGVGTGTATASWGGLLYNAMPLVAAGGLLAVPDAPASLFWTAGLCCAFAAARTSSLRWWLAAGVAGGCACLSKYSALFLGPGILLWLMSSARGRAQLRGPGPWLAAMVAIALFSLNVAWNADHHWATFIKQFGRVAPGRLEPRYLFEFLATQVLLLNPLVALLAVRPAFASLRRLSAATSPVVVALVATSAPFVVYLLFHSLHDRVQGHWPAPVYPAVAICAAIGIPDGKGASLWRKSRNAALVLGLGSCAVALSWFAIPSRLLPHGSDFALPVRGWPVFAGRLEALRKVHDAAWIGTVSYGLTAELATQSQIRAPIVELGERSRYRDLDLGAAPDFSRSGLVVDLTRRVGPDGLGRCFAVVQSLGFIDRGAAGDTGVRYQAFRVSGPTRDLATQGC